MTVDLLQLAQHVKDGDKVILTCKRELSRDEVNHLREVWKQAFEGVNINAVVLPHGVDAVVLRPMVRMVGTEYGSEA
jgi:hypothetical protein